MTNRYILGAYILIKHTPDLLGIKGLVIVVVYINHLCNALPKFIQQSSVRREYKTWISLKQLTVSVYTMSPVTKRSPECLLLHHLRAIDKNVERTQSLG
jgi:hypothetical protein